MGLLKIMQKVFTKTLTIFGAMVCIALSSCASSSSISSEYSGNPTIDTSKLDTNIQLFNNSFDANQLPNQWPNSGIGDPFVYRYNGTYYLYPSTSSRGVRAYKSIDLMNWEPVTGAGLPEGYVVDPIYDETIVAYAPEVTYYDGWFYMCESQAGNGHYFFRSRSPEGPFVPYTGNVGESIDGSFFIDNEGTPYFLRAKAETIRMTKFNDDFTLSNEAFDIQNTSMGGWTEGPYMLSRDGIYYLTFTGVHVASAGYKVGYSYMSGSDNVFVRNGFTRGDNILMNTDDEWNTLGHSSTTLGPDMDSYYIAYHSRTNGVHGRHFNLSRLLFNGTEMAVDRPSLTATIVPDMPAFYTHDPENDLELLGNFLLTEENTAPTFTAEWNFTGSDGRLIYAYQDDSNYNYLSFTGSHIYVQEIKQGSDIRRMDIDLNHNYDINVLHSLRLSYRDGLLDIHFDNMEKINDFELDVAPGKIGYLGNLAPHYTAFSNVGNGSSDNEYLKQDKIYATSFDEEVSSLSASSFEQVTLNGFDSEYFNGKSGSNVLNIKGEDHFSAKIYANETATYRLTMRATKESLGKKIALKIDNNVPLEMTLPSFETLAPSVSLNLGTFSMSAGAHYLTLIRRQDVGFIALGFEPTIARSATYTNSLIENNGDIVIRGAGYSFDEEGITSGTGRSIAYIDRKGYDNVDVSVDMTFNGASSFNSSGIVIRAKNDAYGEWDDVNSLQGYYFGVKNTQAFLIRADYQAKSKQLAINFADVLSDISHTLRVVASGNSLTFYVDGIEEFSVIDPNAYFGGRSGLYSTGAATTFKNISVTPL